jgi:hypothetical protein
MVSQGIKSTHGQIQEEMVCSIQCSDAINILS